MASRSQIDVNHAHIDVVPRIVDSSISAVNKLHSPIADNTDKLCSSTDQQSSVPTVAAEPLTTTGIVLQFIGQYTVPIAIVIAIILMIYVLWKYWTQYRHQQPPPIVITNKPVSTTSIKELPDEHDDLMNYILSDQPSAPLEEPTEEQLDEPLDASLEEPTEEQLDEPLDASLEEPTEEQLAAPLEEPTEEQLDAPLEESTEEQLEDQLDAPLEEITDNIDLDAINDMINNPPEYDEFIVPTVKKSNNRPLRKLTKLII